MTRPTRRTFLAAGGASLALAACSNAVGGRGGAAIDARVDETLRYMFETYPGTRGLAEDANGMLVMPLMTEAGVWFGGGYGRGALRVGGVTVDYYSATQASFGLQLGAQQYSHVLFFMTRQALQEFRTSPGWSAGADLKYAINDQGEMLSADSTTALAPVIAVVFGQAGIMAGAAIEGTKYTRIIP